ncbi:uncharacterized protein PV09_01822 [Verruconis gallopava]|uniref:Uncharacterized protein n=1 Tax=Verruconis gallopava TaxID=253628 RepID=A0A0D2AME0_9PEZI|nr:uncharacterized protein PV09_01822 [Verruconis gallopava]KIW07913.1 hypothetical protein PV09_01822 [Verruconis gallopava]
MVALPPFETVQSEETQHVPSEKRRSGPRKEWDAVAARIAARTANARNTTKGWDGGYGSRSGEKSSSRRQNPGLSIDTSVGKRRASPKQLFPKEMRRQQGPGYLKLGDDNAHQHVVITADQSKSLEQPAFEQQKVTEAQLVSKFSPETPSIIITPALQARLSPDQRARVASSVYSRLTSGATPPTNNGDVPPLPHNLPELMKKSQPLMANNSITHTYPGTSNVTEKPPNIRESTGTAFEEDFDEKKNGRIMSSGTLFEEDQSARYSQLQTVQTTQDFTIDSAITPTPHRSRGWWDVIRTPFERANSKFVRSPTDGERTPEVPAIPPSTHHMPSTLSDGLGLKIMPRNTHNSQALRRLESRDHLQVESAPPMPGKRGSILSTFSPNEREVPFMLHVSPIDKDAKNQGLCYTDRKEPQDTTVRTEINDNSASDFKTTPESVRSEFSPIGQVVHEGQVVTAKGVVQNPLQGSTQSSNQSKFIQKPKSVHNSLRVSLRAELVKVSSPAPVATKVQQEKSWPSTVQAPYFAPPPKRPYEDELGMPREVSQYLGAPFPPTRFSQFDKPKKSEKKLFKRLLKGKSKKQDSTIRKKNKKRRWCCIGCCLLIFLVIILGTVLGVLLSRRRPSKLDQAIWFNVTNYPPIPGGVLTVARPNLRTSVSGCVNPQTMWSCAVPKEQQDSIKPNDPDQPNFVFDIRYDNSSTSNSKSRRSGSYNQNVKKFNFLSARDNPVLQASPQPPALEEYSFLGNTTDGVSEPFEGEATPFYISFKPPSEANFKKFRRQLVERDVGASASATTASPSSTSNSSATSLVNYFPNLSTAFPKPEVNPDGTAQAANLLPFPSFQPLRLFNRGKSDEHYGFYTYFERSIFLRSVSFQNVSQEMIGEVPADVNGGSAEDAATTRCSWTDTRFKVQIFTNLGTSAQILPPPSGSSVPQPGSFTFVRPGSFPYPITITLDRHGGGLTTKMVYCYGLNDQEIPEINSRQFQKEDRAFNGTIVNPSQVFTPVAVSIADGGPGGIDGGTGGCKCEWANWQSK